MKIAVLVSGGVDSSVALHLLKEQGHDVTVFFLKIWLEDELDFLGECPWEEDLKWVRAVCEAAEVPLEVIPLQQQYRERIISYAIDEARAGRTPNPDLLCNQRIKFGAFFEAIGPEFEKVATGHYARLDESPQGYLLKKSPDPVKDQTYFLAHLSQEQLGRALFPIDRYTKAEIRTMAANFNLPNQDRRDSQGLCFLGKIKFSEFLNYHLGEKPGLFIEQENGAIVGSHRGFWFYTIGQRRGLELPGGPWFVADKLIEENIVYVSRHYYDSDRERNEFTVINPHWITTPPLTDKILGVKLRHGPRQNSCRLEFLSDNRLKVVLSERDQGIAPGQFAVFYDDDLCLGCAMIENEVGSQWEKSLTYQHSISQT